MFRMSWIFIFLYLMAQLLIGIWISRRISSESDYLLAGRSLPLFMVAFSLFATWFGAETCIGSSAAVYERGLSGSRADPFGYSICLLLLGLLLAARFRRGNYVTLADYFRERYGIFIEKITIWIIVPSSLIWAAAQIRAFGQIIAATTFLNVTLAITIAAAFVVVYTFLGGLLSDVYTDLIQGIVVVFGLVVLFGLCIHSIPGLRQILSSMDPIRLSLIAPQETLLMRLDRWMVPILGSLVAQEAISRVLAARSVSVARNASFLACGIYFVMGAIPAFLGLIGPYVVPDLQDPEHFLVRLAARFLPQALFVLFAGALISAIIATIDSILLAIAALLSHNFIVPLFSIKSDRGRVLSARLIVVFAGGFAYVLALYGRGVYNLVLAASAFGTAGVLVITLMGFFTKMGGRLSAALALIAGLIITPLGTYVFPIEAPFLASIFGAFVAFLLGGILATEFERDQD
jgi:Na+/proline symporter